MSELIPDEIRAAIDYGQALAVRRILDALAKDRPKVGAFILTHPERPLTSGTKWDPDHGAACAAGYDEAVWIVKRYRVGAETTKETSA